MRPETPNLEVVEFQTVGACNARCTICPWPEVGLGGLPRELPEPIWEAIVADIADLRPKQVIPYLNNEPLLDRRLEERIARIKAVHGDAEIEVSTNGSLLREERIRRLFEVGTSDLLISVFGYDETSYRSVMGLDFRRVSEHIELAARIKRETGATTRIKVIQVAAPHVPPERFKEAGQRWLDIGVEVDVYGYLDRAGNVGQSRPGPSQRDPRLAPRGCELRRHQSRTYILADGTVLFCCHDWRRRHPLGNITVTRLRDIWEGRQYREVRDQVEGVAATATDFLCRHCKLSPARED